MMRCRCSEGGRGLDTLAALCVLGSGQKLHKAAWLHFGHRQGPSHGPLVELPPAWVEFLSNVTCNKRLLRD